ncbi:PREDICTED: uncharacterized protein LOC106790802 [Polistes canadensis]|uniref:uncharacterized protein LOC106790802 n=1 Tax=Polistes canadensis TaxID=91411 RepID=UPI000718C24F|nr:PREDICTED: uncharacterized protein LOC106790802 [Polistes canadensis]
MEFLKAYSEASSWLLFLVTLRKRRVMLAENIIVLSGIPIKRSLASTLRRKLKNLAESPKVLLLLGESSSSSSITSRTEAEAESESEAKAEAEAEAEIAAVPRSSSQGTTGLYLESLFFAWSTRMTILLLLLLLLSSR